MCSTEVTIWVTTSTGMTAMTSRIPRRSRMAREKMLDVSPCSGRMQPTHRVDDDSDTTDQGQQGEADPHDRDVDAGRFGDPAADAGQHPGIRAPAQWAPQASARTAMARCPWRRPGAWHAGVVPRRRAPRLRGGDHPTPRRGTTALSPSAGAREGAHRVAGGRYRWIQGYHDDPRLHARNHQGHP